MLSVILDDTRDPARNLALDEAIARAVPARAAPGGRRRERAPVLRVWQNAPSIVVGRFQDALAAVDVRACARDGIAVVRRATGGGAVCFDAGTLAFTLVQARPGQVRAEPAVPPPRPPVRQVVRRATGAEATAARRTGRDAPPRPDAPCPGCDAGALPGGARGVAGFEGLVAGAVEGFGVPAAAVRGGVVRAARLRTRSAHLVHVAVQVRPGRASAGRYLTDPGAARPTLADYGLDTALDAVRAAVLGAIVHEYGAARTRGPDPGERAVRDHLHAVRYGDLAWQLTGGRGAAAGTAGRRTRVRR